MSTSHPEPFFCSQIGIMNVVWLDDLFDPHTVPNTIDIAEQVAVAIAAGVTITHAKLADLTAADSAQEWARRIQERLGESEIAELLNQIRPPRADESTAVALDYSPSELEEVSVVARKYGAACRIVALVRN